MKKRLQKFLSEAGVASRRKCEEIIAQGRVKVNGQTTTRMGQVIDAGIDKVELDGILLQPEERKIYLIMNKPANTVTSCMDERGRKTVLDVVGDIGARVFPVGRLDYDTEGLLILTNDGDFANTVMHPKNNISKTYLALTDQVLDPEVICQLENGVFIDGRMTSKARVRSIQYGNSNQAYTIEIHEGRNRQIKKMLEAVGKKVLYLKRLSIGNISLGTLKPGEFRKMTDDEKNYLKSAGR